MFNILKTAPTPSLARKLLKFSEVRNVDLSSEMVELALDDLLTIEDFKGFGLHLTSGAIAAIQHHRDWGRSVMVSSNYQMATNAALANVWQRPGKTVIISEMESVDGWVSSIKHIWPDSTISLSGNRRYQDNYRKTSKVDIQVTSEPDLACDFIIMSARSVTWHDIMGKLECEHTIIDRMPETMRRDELYVLFKEIPNPIIIQSLHTLPTSHGITVDDGIESHSNNTFDYLMKMIDGLWCGRPPIKMRLDDDVLEKHSALRNYHLTAKKYLELQGVSFDLLRTNDRHKSYVVFGHKSTASRDTNGAITGKEISKAISAALEGDRLSLGFLEQYRTHSWSMAKAYNVQGDMTKVTSSQARCVIICENDYLNRAMRLCMSGNVLGDFRTNQDPDVRQSLVDRFVKDPLYVRDVQKAIPLKKIMMTMDEFLELSDVLMDHRTFLVIPDISSVDPRIIPDLMDLCKAHSTKMILSIFLNTHEDFFLKEIQKNTRISAK